MGWDSKAPQGAYGSGLWKGISKVYEAFQNNVGLKVGRGDLVYFWKDVWCCEVALETAFPSIYQLAGKKEGLVQQHYTQNDDMISWQLHLRRNLYN